MSRVEKMEATLHRDLYLESSWFAKERENIFFDQWFCVGRDEDLAAPGSYRALDLAGESIILVHGNDNGFRAFYMDDLSRDVRTYVAARLNTALPSD